MDENRRDKRAEIELPVIAGGSIRCTLLDISSSGAKLKSSRPLPDTFYLLLKSDLKRWCSVMWRRADQTGVKFIEEPKQVPAVQVLVCR
ncbi:MAG: PilZ domain-containing protein [Pseudorhodoplanes sp.]